MVLCNNESQISLFHLGTSLIKIQKRGALLYFEKMKMRITGYVPSTMINLDKCAVHEEDMDDIDFLTDKLIAKGLTKKEEKELRFLRKLNGLGE